MVSFKKKKIGKQKIILLPYRCTFFVMAIVLTRLNLKQTSSWFRIKFIFPGITQYGVFLSIKSVKTRLIGSWYRSPALIL